MMQTRSKTFDMESRTPASVIGATTSTDSGATVREPSGNEVRRQVGVPTPTVNPGNLGVSQNLDTNSVPAKMMASGSGSKHAEHGKGSTLTDSLPIGLHGENSDVTLVQGQTRQQTSESGSSTNSSRRKEILMEARHKLLRRQMEEAAIARQLAAVELEMCQFDDDKDDEQQWNQQKSTFHKEDPFIGAFSKAPWMISDKKEPIKPTSKPTPEPMKSEIGALAEAIILATKGKEMPPKYLHELPMFDGSCDEWIAFKKVYEDTSNLFDDVQNMVRLRKAVKGAAREAVKSLLYVSTYPSEIMSALERRFGRPDALVLVELEKVKRMPKLIDSPREICTFANMVNNTVATIKALKKPFYLHSPELCKCIIDKFTSILRYRWYDFRARYMYEEEPELVKIDRFLSIEADICGAYAPPEIPEKMRGRHDNRERHRVNTTQDDYKTPQKNNDVRSTVTKKFCVHCNGEHWINECQQFKNETVEGRWNIVRKLQLCFLCLRRRHQRVNCRGSRCKKCNRTHHTLLHSDVPALQYSSNGSPTNGAQGSSSNSGVHNDGTVKGDTDTKSTVSSVNVTSSVRAFLKIIPVEIYGTKSSAKVLALLDEGSTVSLLDSAVAEKIGVTGPTEPLLIETVGGRKIEKRDSTRLDLKIRGIHRTDKRNMNDVRTIDCLDLSPQYVDKKLLESCSHLKGLTDKLTYNMEKPRLLIGQDNWGLIVSRKIKKGDPKHPVASLTSLGWVLHGRHSSYSQPVNFVNYCSTLTKERDEEDQLGELIKHHFSIESLGVQPKRPSTDSEGRALALLEETSKRLPNGRFETGLLWKKDDEKMPNNYSSALKRLVNVERKLDKNENLKEEYGKQIQHLIDSDYAEIAPAAPTSERTWYLPHFAVTHPTKGKIRIVFDAAARSDGKCLNDALLTGPDLLQSLFGVLVRFRQGPVAVVADIKEMFLQIKIREEDRDSLRFLWRKERRSGTPQEYRMTSVIFGAASSPSTAIFIKNKNASEFQKEQPEAVKAIEKNHYMDDYLQSFGTEEEAIRISKEVDQIHKAAGFELRGWATNKENVLKSICPGESCKTDVALGQKKEEKTLGLCWRLEEDALVFNTNLRNTPADIIEGQRKPTKREVTSAVMSTFDPMGLASPLLIQGKKLIQELWRSGIDWDTQIEDVHFTAWMNYIKNLEILRKLLIPRCLAPSMQGGELHTFTDASETAYAAAVYWRTEEPDGSVHVTLIAGKARVTQPKPISMPRLKLQASLLGARLASSVEEELELHVKGKTYWTDSSTVLSWIKTDPRTFKPFVAHRLAELEDLTKPSQWRWVPSAENVADDGTRNTPKEFDENHRWFKGPSFLYERKEKWPEDRKFGKIKLTGEEKAKEILAHVRMLLNESTPDSNRFSSWQRLLRTTARVIMFINLCRRRQKVASARKIKTNDTDPTWKLQCTKKRKVSKDGYCETKKLVQKERRVLLPLEPKYLVEAERLLIKKSQEECFAKELASLRNEKPLEKSLKFNKLDVWVDNEGIIRLKGRIDAAREMEADKKNPVLLEGRNHMTRLLIAHYHEKFFHGNHATVINEIRQRYWILRLRNTVRSVLHACQWCRVHRNKPQLPPTGNLPSERLQYGAHPFICTAVDYFGPMFVTIGRRQEKRWGALFTCLTTRAIHLELAASLSTDSMVMALRRMIARRGTPRVIYSDNGTNFVGANRELQEELQKMKKAEIASEADLVGIRWKFIPPGAPNMGGAWERMVRSVKTALATVLKEKSPPEEVLYTLLLEVEHTVNSRPLTHISADPNDEEALTPNHFLIGRSNGAPILGNFEENVLIKRASWRTAQKLADHFWQRWLKEYLPTLLPRQKKGRSTKDPEIGDVVLIVDSALPRNLWPRGKVLKTYPGPDGRIRIIDVKTTGGVLRRPSSKIVVIEHASSPYQKYGAEHGGEDVGDRSE